MAPGMTGFARVFAQHRRALAISREAVSSLSAGKGVVRVVDDSGHLDTTLVALGDIDDRFVEITEGLDVSAWVLTKNARYLRDDDKISITRIVATRD